MSSHRKMIGIVATTLSLSLGASYHYYVKNDICPTRLKCVYKDGIIIPKTPKKQYSERKLCTDEVNKHIQRNQ